MAYSKKPSTKNTLAHNGAARKKAKAKMAAEKKRKVTTPKR